MARFHAVSALLLAAGMTGMAQTLPASPEAVVTDLYAALSFPPGKGVDPVRLRALFAPGARILRAGRLPDGTPEERAYTLDTFLDFATPKGEGAMREERALWQRAERFGDIAHVFSAYELSFTAGAASGPTVRRGINSVQLHFDGSAWRIVSLIWDVERPGVPVPGPTESTRR